MKYAIWYEKSIIRKVLMKILNAIKGLTQKYTETKAGMSDTRNTKVSATLCLERDTETNLSTLGKLYLDNEFIAHTLELSWLDNQKRVSCIPQGVYKVRKRKGEESKKYTYDHWHIMSVPNRSKILIHIGNYPKDTWGCILVGEYRRKDSVVNSTIAFELLKKKLDAFDDITIVIISKNSIT